MIHRGAYWFGIVFIVVGVIGFFFDGTFDTWNTKLTPDEYQDLAQGDVNGNAIFGIFETNGFHNLLHIITGVMLLALSIYSKIARWTLIAVAVMYVLTVPLALIGGGDIFGLVPVNVADHFLHLILALVAVVLALGYRRHRAPAEEHEEHIDTQPEHEVKIIEEVVYPREHTLTREEMLSRRNDTSETGVVGGVASVRHERPSRRVRQIIR